MSNDAKIKEYREKIKAKRAELGEKPRPHYETNGLIVLPDNHKVNINLLSTVEACVDVVQQLLTKANAFNKANELLSTNIECTFGKYTLYQCVGDIKTRVHMIEWEAGKKTLDAMDRKLAELLSNDAKTEDTINNIAKELDL